MNCHGNVSRYLKQPTWAFREPHEGFAPFKDELKAICFLNLGWHSETAFAQTSQVIKSVLEQQSSLWRYQLFLLALRIAKLLWDGWKFVPKLFHKKAKHSRSLVYFAAILLINNFSSVIFCKILSLVKASVRKPLKWANKE